MSTFTNCELRLRLRRWVISGLVLVVVLSGCSSADSTAEEAPGPPEPFRVQVTATSPDTLLRIEVGLDDTSRPRYRVVREVDGVDHIVVLDSTLGLETSAGSFTTATELTITRGPTLVTDSFELPHGKQRSSTVEATALSLAADDLDIDLWVANTGVAFRYRIDSPEQMVTIDWERTSFAMPPENRTWLQPHDEPSYAQPAYEQLRSRERSADSPSPSRFGYTFPALFADDRTWTLITETALDDGAAGSHFSPAVTNGEYLLDFANRGEGNGIGDPRPTATESWTSPWRLIITSTDLGDIVESNLVRHLSPAAEDPQRFEWVEPGRVSWSWWSDHASSRDADAMEPFIDLAAELGWQYSLVDANWNTIESSRMQSLIDYAAERDVGLMLWYNSGGPHNGVTEAPRDLITERATRRAEFERIAGLGIRGVKVDFFHSDKPVTIQLYRDIMSDAADFELLVNFHGSTVPRGWSREFPNLMTMEAVRGAEIYTFDSTYQRVAPRQNTVLPFTRNVVGPMDYTPVILGDEELRTTTNGHELALAVVFESPLLHLIDTPDAYLGQPSAVVDLLREVPTVWDETQFIDGSPESHAVIARRLREEWWIGGINALDESLAVTVDLGALGIEKGAAFVRVCDDPAWDRLDAGTYLDPTQYVITTDITEQDLSLSLAPTGGCLVRIGS